MSGDRVERIKDLFVSALELEPGEREAFLQRACGGDAAVRAEVESLLAAEGETPQSFMHLAAYPGTIRQDSAATRGPIAPPERIGRYRIVRPLGEGGMSVVYLAEQDHPRRQVAVKVIRPGAMSTSMYNRFEHEAHVLGQLKHEGIAQIYEADSESTPTGPVPFFAMEFVEGEMLHRYAEKQGLDPRSRLRLLALVCDAVHHAHQKGVLHRDLKPPNILVARSRQPADASGRSTVDVGQPKILDFGVARAINSDLQLTTLATKPGQIIGTIPYMSPEQIQGNSDELDVRSDVYALGVIGYELLAGKLPHDLGNCAIAEAARIIREVDPPSIGMLCPHLRGDVSTILAKAMDKDKQRRYQSAAELAADIRRYLDDEPILARPPTTFYQLRKFARRHRGLVAGAMIGGLALVVGLVVAVQQAVVATAARDRAQELAYQANITAAASALATHDIALARQNLQEIASQYRQWEWRHLSSQLNHSLLDIESPAEGTPGRPHFRRAGDELVLVVPFGERLLAWDAHSGERRPMLDEQADKFAVSSEGAAEAVFRGDSLTVTNLATGTETTTSVSRLGLPTSATPDLVEVSNDGRYVATASGNDVFRIDIESGEVGRVEVDRRHTGVLQMAVSDQGLVAIAAAIRGMPALWDSGSGDLVPLTEVPDFVRSLQFSRDGTRLAVGLQNSAVMVWEVGTRKPIAIGRGHRHAVTDVAFAPGGKRRIVSVSLDRTIRFWDAATLTPLSVLHGHDRGIWHVAFSSDDSLLATAGEGRTVSVWDAAREWPATVIARHDNMVFPVVFSDDGAMIASAGWDRTIRLIDSQSHEPLATLPVDADLVSFLVFSPDGRRLAAVTDRGLLAWDLVSGAPFPPPREADGQPAGRGARAVSFEEDSIHAVLPRAGKHSRVWNTTTGELVSRDARTGLKSGRLVSADGRFRIEYEVEDSASPDPRSARSDSGTGLRIIDGTTGQACSVPSLSGAFAFGMTPDRHVHVAARLEDDRTDVCVWDLTSGRQVGLLQGHAENVYSVAYSPDGTRIATAGRDSIRLWDAVTLKQIVQLNGHTSFVWSVAFSPDGTQLISGSGDRSVRVWDTKSYRERYGLRRQRERMMEALRPEVRRWLGQSESAGAALGHLCESRELDERGRQIAQQAVLIEALRAVSDSDR